MKRDFKREYIAKRAAKEIKDGFYVNLGIGIPTLVASYIPKDITVLFHTENGMIGMGLYPSPGEEDPDLINAGKETITEIKGASYFSSDESFGMIRGGHLDLTIIGAMQVDQEGNLANWSIPGRSIKGMGGAMDLVAGAKRVIITMLHTASDGSPKILKKCTLPLTGKRVVDLIITDLATIEVTPKGLVLKETASGVSVEEVIKNTTASLIVDKRIHNL